MSFKPTLCALMAITYFVCSVQAYVGTIEKKLSGKFRSEKIVSLECDPKIGDKSCDIREVSTSGGNGVLKKVQLRYEVNGDLKTVDCRRKGNTDYVCNGQLIAEHNCLEVVLTPGGQFVDVTVSVKSVNYVMGFVDSCGGSVNGPVNEITREKTLGGPFNDEIIVSLDCEPDSGEDCDLREVSTSGGYGVLYKVELKYEDTDYHRTKIVDCWEKGDTNFVCNGQWTIEKEGFTDPNPRVVLTPDLGLGNGPVGNVKVSVKSIDGTMRFA